jgi:threonine synthase
MDVGDPSNMERLRGLLGEADVLREQLGVKAVTDEQIEAAIVADFAAFGFATCPHTATATHVWRHLTTAEHEACDWILVATAHPAKFETVVEPLIGTAVPLPEGLEAILARSSRDVLIEPTLSSLAASMREHFGV